MQHNLGRVEVIWPDMVSDITRIFISELPDQKFAINHIIGYLAFENKEKIILTSQVIDIDGHPELLTTNYTVIPKPVISMVFLESMPQGKKEFHLGELAEVWND